MYTKAPSFLIEMGKALDVRSHRGQQVETLPNSPVLAFISIPRSTIPPSPPLRLLCAEAAFHHLVLQGGKRARKEGLTNQQAKQRRRKKTREKQKTGVGKVNIQKVRERKRSQYWNQTQIFQTEFSPRQSR